MFFLNFAFISGCDLKVETMYSLHKYTLEFHGTSFMQNTT